MTLLPGELREGVSVVLPTYNRANRLAQAIDSILSQEWAVGEVIVVDDGSNDETPELLAEYVDRFPDQIRVIRQQNSGAAIARNVGIQAATLRFVAFADSDDVWLPGKLGRQMALLTSRPELEFCFAAYTAAGANYLEDIILEPWFEDPEWILERLLISCCIAVPTVVAARDRLRELGLFDPGLPIGEDYDLWLKWAEAGHPMAYIPEPLAIVNQGLGLSADRIRMNTWVAEVVDRHATRARLPATLTHGPGWYRAHRHLNNACDYLELSDGAAAARSLARAFRSDPASVRPGWILVLVRALAGSLRQRRSGRTRSENPAHI